MKNMIKGIVNEGYFKGQEIELIIGRSSKQSQIFVNGKPLIAVTGITITMDAEDFTRITIEHVANPESEPFFTGDSLEKSKEKQEKAKEKFMKKNKN